MQQNNATNALIVKAPDHQTFMARKIGEAHGVYWRKYGEFYAECLLYKFKLDEVSVEAGRGYSVQNYLGYMAAVPKSPSENGLACAASMGILASDIE